jgi:hypothetical protein
MLDIETLTAPREGDMTFRASVERYLGAVSEQYRRKDATENSYCDGLKQLWEGIGPEVSNSHTKLTVLPSQTARSFAIKRTALARRCTNPVGYWRYLR